MKEADVPIKISGRVVGTAKIREDGSISMEIAPNQYGGELFIMLETGLTNSLKIASVDKPAVNLHNAKHVQIGHGNVQNNHF